MDNHLIYAVRDDLIDGNLVRLSMHREILGLANDDTRQVSHVSGDTLDNRQENLRIVARGGHCVQTSKPAIPIGTLLSLVEKAYEAECAFDDSNDALVADEWATRMGTVVQTLSLETKTRMEGEHEVHLFPSIDAFVLVGSNGKEFKPKHFFGRERTRIVRIEYRPK